MRKMMRSGGRQYAAISEITIIKLKRDQEAALVKSALLAGTTSDS